MFPLQPNFLASKSGFFVGYGAMSRFLFLVVVVVIVYWLLKSYRKQLPGEGAQGKDDREEDTPRQAEDMVRCVHCGVHLPKHESILAGGKFYCGEAHRIAHTERPE